MPNRKESHHRHRRPPSPHTFTPYPPIYQTDLSRPRGNRPGLPIPQLLAPRRRRGPHLRPVLLSSRHARLQSEPPGNWNPCTARTTIQDRFVLLAGASICLLPSLGQPAPGRHPGRDRHRLAWSTRDRQEHPDPRTIMGMPCILFFARPAEKINLPSRGHENQRGRHQAAA
jgi:hypothetical protein